ncbi:hypothetical protein [Methylogaea oryzae]|uniref:hypothetical protein n=1 Tax=Methylogaea oryzae TaxID=1295382 RepID=UPI0012E27B45|nr:hypothetical protein [Methylogaea oryzae]
MMKKVLAGLAGVVALASSNAFAASVEIKGAGVAFAPAVVFANVGDTLAFRNMASHFVESYPGMIPEGAAPMKSDMAPITTTTPSKKAFTSTSARRTSARAWPA